MKILSITAGAAGMYCGSCARDNALARRLLDLGHDVTLIPVYTPTRTDEPNVSRPQVLFGGISVYLQQYLGLFRFAPRFLDRLWDAPSVIGAFAGRMVSNDPRLLGQLTLSMLQGESGVLQREFRKLLDWIRSEPLPDIINLPNSLLIALAEPLRREVRRPVVCTLQGEELFIQGLIEPYRTQAIELIRRRIPDVDHFIAVSQYCSTFMMEYLGIPASRISVVPLGINMQGYQRRDTSALPGRPYRIGYFARVAPEKGLHVLADAYVRFRRNGGPEARLEAAGYASPAHKPYLDTVKDILKRAGLQDEFTYHGVVDREGKLAFLRSLDVLSVPATYDEPKGMFLLEAMACGVPVVQPRRGAFIEIVERTGGGLLVAPDNIDGGLAGTFQLLCGSPETALTLGENGFKKVRVHYSIEVATARLLDVYEAIVHPALTGTQNSAN
ncbi:MAG TPA: glycosyltransferase family 4 protein [Terriglobia bacterium]|nr:glycosyltransferase family 4 protein [Terriglobia bacterium]